MQANTQELLGVVYILVGRCALPAEHLRFALKWFSDVSFDHQVRFHLVALAAARASDDPERAARSQQSWGREDDD
jgi:hypothetical protein